MNPRLEQRAVDDALNDDAARASAEYLAQVRSDIELFLRIETVEVTPSPSRRFCPASKAPITLVLLILVVGAKMNFHSVLRTVLAMA